MTDLSRLLIELSEEKRAKLSDDDILRNTKLLELDIRKEELVGQQQDRAERKKFANKIFALLVVFLFVTLGIVVSSGIKNLCFELSDTIMITLLATTAADIIGIFIFVVRYLFKANICPKCGIRVSQTQN